MYIRSFWRGKDAPEVRRSRWVHQQQHRLSPGHGHAQDLHTDDAICRFMDVPNNFYILSLSLFLFFFVVVVYSKVVPWTLFWEWGPLLASYSSTPLERPTHPPPHVRPPHVRPLPQYILLTPDERPPFLRTRGRGDYWMLFELLRSILDRLFHLTILTCIRFFTGFDLQEVCNYNCNFWEGKLQLPIALKWLSLVAQFVSQQHLHFLLSFLKFI